MKPSSWLRGVRERLFGQARPREARRRRLGAELLEARLTPASPVVSVLAPAANSHTAAVSTDLVVTFDQAVSAATVTPTTLVTHGGLSGRLLLADVTALTVSGPTVTLDRAGGFLPGEVVQVTATAGTRTPGQRRRRRTSGSSARRRLEAPGRSCKTGRRWQRGDRAGPGRRRW